MALHFARAEVGEKEFVKRVVWCSARPYWSTAQHDNSWQFEGLATRMLFPSSCSSTAGAIAATSSCAGALRSGHRHCCS
eukprot:2764500-Karenia_brevis.AAC.1